MKISQAMTVTERMLTQQWELLERGEYRDSEMVVPYPEGSPGLGKTAIAHHLSRKFDCELQIMSLAQYDAGELGGWKVPNKESDAMISLRPDWMPTKGRGILFFDEIPQAPVANMNICAQTANERRIGKHKLPDGWVIMGAGNKSTDRAGTNSMPAHLVDRLCFIEVEADLEDSIAYFYSVEIDQRICAFLRFRPEYLHQFDRNAKACPSPRSWDRVNSILKLGLDDVLQTATIAGQVGPAAAADFNGFLKVYEAVPDIDELIKYPDEAATPSDPAVLYAICAALAYRMDKRTSRGILRYLTRLPRQEFAVFVVKDATNRNKTDSQDPHLREWMKNHGRHLV
jgi:hypothetical protein